MSGVSVRLKSPWAARRRVLLVVVAALALVLASLTLAPSAKAGELDCKNYGYACTPGYTGANANGPWAGRYYGNGYAATSNGTHNCTLYAAWKLQQAGMKDPGRNWGNAVDWARNIGGGNKTPTPGSIAWWGASRGKGAGHVAYVEQVSGNQVFLRADNFVSSGGYTTAGWVPASSVELFLHPFDLPTAVPAGNPFGSLDGMSRAPGGIRVLGWAIDPDTTAPIAVHAYSGSGAPGAGNPGAAATANVVRDDVGRVHPAYGSRHGYDFVVAAAGAGRQTICTYGINNGPGVNPQIGCRTIDISADPFGSVDEVRRVPGGVQVSGWAIDPDTGGPIDVHVYGGTGNPGQGPGAATRANLSRPDVANVHPNYGAAHGYSVFLALGPQAQTVCAYGINNGPGINPRLGCKSV